MSNFKIYYVATVNEECGVGVGINRQCNRIECPEKNTYAYMIWDRDYTTNRERKNKQLKKNDAGSKLVIHVERKNSILSSLHTEVLNRLEI